MFRLIPGFVLAMTFMLSSAFADNLEAGLTSHLSASQAQLAKAQSPAARAKVVTDLKLYLKEQEDHLGSLDPAKSRPFRMSVHALNEFFNLIDETKLTPVDCERYEAKIRYSAMPHTESTADSTEDLPGEARETIKFLKKLCP